MSSPASTATLSPSPSPPSARHAASLVDPARHSPAMTQLIDVRLTKPVVQYLIDTVVDAVDFAMGRSPRSHVRFRASFTTFVNDVLTRAEVAPATVLAALVYIARARAHLSIALEEWALERVFLGALIVASKYTNDSTLKNVHWALCTGVFGKRDVGRIEREFLEVLDWELGIREADLMAHHTALVAVAFPGGDNDKQALSVPAFTRKHTRASSVPELAPSSPVSSAGSLSPGPAHTRPFAPRTPPLLSISTPPKKSPPFPPPAPARRCGKLHGLLRAFPLPLPRHHHRLHVAT
ncbi:Cyclin N-terminal domain-containing protein [Mycena indigotica]|uniref:Cyclin N-terminal domain-containing protein n=1 Tax=Mycena indigotica TaxID=2126181 RepID=A0A8H6WBD7_9AGAR|nr:Cyclin N-terminal domain-containing protein [Mycena indigotica]KAF7310126.1 Cyclin N-terminal domain-containing protein [Mycena indigotica]